MARFRPAAGVRRVGLAVVSGVLLLLAFPPVGLWWTAVPAVAALLLAIDGTSRRHGWALGVLTHLVLFLPLLEWTRFVGVLPWLLLSLIQAAIAGVAGLVLASNRRRLSDRPTALLVPAVAGTWVAAEAVRGRVPFGGFTWGRLAFAQADGPLVGAAALGGAPLVTALVAALGALLFAAARHRRAGRRPRLAVIGAAAAIFVGAPLLLRPALTPPPIGSVEVAAVQGNVPRAGIDALAEDRVVLENHLRQTELLAAEVRAGKRPRPDLVIWPENASDQDPRTDRLTGIWLRAAAGALDDRPFLLGAVLNDGSTLGNALLVWSGDGIEGQPYVKRHLVPFGEYLPLRGLVQRLYPSAAELLPRDFTPGGTVGRLDLAGVPLAVGTCFEVAFDELPRQAVQSGGQLLVLPSNNASYGRSGQSAQQLAIAQLRAVEHGRATVVATTSGISALIGSDGAVLQRSDLYRPAVLQGRLPRASALTPATRWGAPIEIALVSCVGLLLVGSAPMIRTIRRRQRPLLAEGRRGSAPPEAPDQSV